MNTIYLTLSANSLTLSVGQRPIESRENYGQNLSKILLVFTARAQGRFIRPLMRLVGILIRVD